jgi:peptide methionine sulfoxide reductase MsrB
MSSRARTSSSTPGRRPTSTLTPLDAAPKPVQRQNPAARFASSTGAVKLAPSVASRTTKTDAKQAEAPSKVTPVVKQAFVVPSEVAPAPTTPREKVLPSDARRHSNGEADPARTAKPLAPSQAPRPSPPAGASAVAGQTKVENASASPAQAKPKLVPSPPRQGKPTEDARSPEPTLPWPSISDTDRAVIDSAAMEARGGEYAGHFPSHGQYCCRRCRAVVARSSSKVRIPGGFAAFVSYYVPSLECRMVVARHSTAFNVRCRSCGANIGMLAKEPTSTGDCLRVNSTALWYVPQDTLPAEADSNFDSGARDASEESSDDDGNDFDDMMDEAFGPSAP